MHVLYPQCLPVCLPVYLSVCPSVCLSVCLSACLPAGLPACKKIWSKIAKIKKLVTHTPLSTKRTNRVASKFHTSGIDKIFFLSDLISRGLRGKHTEKSGQNKRKKILITCWVNTVQFTAKITVTFRSHWHVVYSNFGVWPFCGLSRTTFPPDPDLTKTYIRIRITNE